MMIKVPDEKVSLVESRRDFRLLEYLVVSTPTVNQIKSKEKEEERVFMSRSDVRCDGVFFFGCVCKEV